MLELVKLNANQEIVGSGRTDCRIRKKKNDADPCTKRFENLCCWKENPVGLLEKLFADLNVLPLCEIFRSGKIDADPDLRVLGQKGAENEEMKETEMETKARTKEARIRNPIPNRIWIRI